MDNKKEIKHILFDLGGVLLNIDYQLTEDAFKNLGLIDFDEIYSQARQEGLFDDFEIGRVGKNDFIKSLSDKMQTEVSESNIMNAWNAMLLDFPIERIEMLEFLTKKYDVSLLSNTNEIHYEAFMYLFEESHKRSFNELFKSTYYSHLIGMRKPDKEVFLHIIEKEGLKAEELLFIDDSVQHVEGARKLEIQSLFLEKGDDIVSLLHRSGILT